MRFSEEKLHQLVEQKLRPQIEEARKNLDSEKIAVPFLPYVGNDYAQAKHKVLVVGKATYGWKCKDVSGNNNESLAEISLEDPEWWHRLEEAPKNFIEGCVLPFYAGREGYKSLFWNRIYRILGDLLSENNISRYDRDESVSQTVFRSFAWTNVFKLAGLKGNPRKKLREPQIQSNSLPDEISYLEPDVILFFTGPSYDKYLCEIFQEMSLAEPNSLKQVPGVREQARVTLRTYHPQSGKFCFKEVTDLIRDNLSRTQ
jgi:hypothetical protein